MVRKSTFVTFEVDRIEREGVTLDVLGSNGEPLKDQTIFGQTITRTVMVPRRDDLLTAQPGDRFVLTPALADEAAGDG